MTLRTNKIRPSPFSIRLTTSQNQSQTILVFSVFRVDIFSLGSTESFDFRQLVINEASNGTFDFRSNDLKPNQRETDFQLSHLKPDHRYRLTILAIDRRSRAGTDLIKAILQFFNFIIIVCDKLN